MDSIDDDQQTGKLVDKLLGALTSNNLSLIKMLLPIIPNIDKFSIIIYACGLDCLDILQYINVYYNNILITFDKNQCDKLIDRIMKYKAESVLKYLTNICQNFKDRSNTKLCYYAAKYNHLDILKYLRLNQYLCDNDILSKVLLDNHLDIIIYLCKSGFEYTPHDRCKVIQHGLLNVLKCIDKIGNIDESVVINIDFYKYPIDLCIHGNIAMIEYLHKRNEKFSKKIMIMACKQADCNLIRYLYSIKCEFSDDALELICLMGALCQVKFVLSNNVHFPPSAFDIACLHDHHIIVDYLVKSRHIGTNKAIEYASANKNTHLVNLLTEL